jgi:hypothetical protein
LRSSTHSGGTKSGSSSSGTFSLVYAGVSKALIVSTCQPDPGLQIGGEVGCGVIRVANRDNASVDVALGLLTQAGPPLHIAQVVGEGICTVARRIVEVCQRQLDH